MGASAACPGPGAGTRAAPACPVPACLPCGAPAPGAGVRAALALACRPLTPALPLRRPLAPASGACAAATVMVRCSAESGLTSLTGLGALKLGAGASALRRNAALAPPRPGAGAKAGATAFVLLPVRDVGRQQLQQQFCFKMLSKPRASFVRHACTGRIAALFFSLMGNACSHTCGSVWQSIQVSYMSVYTCSHDASPADLPLPGSDSTPDIPPCLAPCAAGVVAAVGVWALGACAAAGCLPLLGTALEPFDSMAPVHTRQEALQLSLLNSPPLVALFCNPVTSFLLL